MDRELETGRHHPDHGVLASIELDCAPEDIGISAEMFSPEIVTDHDFESAGAAAGLFVRAGKCAAHRRLDPEHFKKVCAHLHAPQTYRAFITR